MGVRNPNSTNYIHADESNILNLHKAMTYDVEIANVENYLSNKWGL